MSFPPCTLADFPTYATVQFGRDKHLNLNSDLLYINHSCEPSLIFDTANLAIIAGPKGLKPGDELTFFYPSTEWSMSQAFDCLCGTPSCRGRISGAKDMTDAQLEGLWINGHIRELLEEQKTKAASANGTAADDSTAQALKDALQHAEKVVIAARAALSSYVQTAGSGYGLGYTNGSAAQFGVDGLSKTGSTNGSQRRGPTSRELSGEMGGDTIRA
ncbi:hypothetical protein BR93DRAFT_927937 [Coniochaeta sp. PMI_546]|nr:hypothetical protein BR93DRAFT_927937 [Coniochaeta sp. PMI_546]